MYSFIVSFPISRKRMIDGKLVECFDVDRCFLLSLKRVMSDGCVQNDDVRVYILGSVWNPVTTK